MLENHPFCDHCPGCRPALIEAGTGQALAPDSPLMIAVNRIWDQETTYAERKAFMEVTVHNSRTSDDVRLARSVVTKFHNAMEAIKQSPPKGSA